jgi:hypothetical protein
VSSLGALLIAVAVDIGIWTYQMAAMWTPLQRWYWGQYLITEVFPTRASSPCGYYRLLAKVDRHGSSGWPSIPTWCPRRSRAFLMVS